MPIISFLNNIKVDSKLKILIQEIEDTFNPQIINFLYHFIKQVLAILNYHNYYKNKLTQHIKQLLLLILFIYIYKNNKRKNRNKEEIWNLK